MHPKLSEDLNRLPELLEHVRSSAVKMLCGLEKRPVATPPTTFIPTPLPDHGVGADATLARFQDTWAAGFSGSAGGRYLGFVTGGATPASVAGDWITSTLDQNVVTRTDSSALDLEHETVGWLRSLFGLRDEHGGTFVSGATMSNFVGLAIAREWIGEQRGISVADSGAGALGNVTVLSGSPHSSIYKALSMLGLGRDCLRLVSTGEDREAVDVERLEAELSALNGQPAIVVANSGTVNTVDFDDLQAIAALKERFAFWLHVDGAFGAFAALSPEHSALVDGIAEADSVCVDLHKWLNVPYDSAVQFSRRPDLQVRIFQNAAAYLGLPEENPDFVHLTPESSRRLRALPTWFTLNAYGVEGHREIVERTISLARDLGDRISTMPQLRLLAPVRLNVVCFTLTERPTKERVDMLAHHIASSGEAFLTPTLHNGIPALRAAFSNWRTTRSDVERIASAVSSAASATEAGSDLGS